MEKSNPNPCAIYWWIEGKKQGPRFYCTLYNAFIASTIKGASKIKKHVTIMTTISIYFYVPKWNQGPGFDPPKIQRVRRYIFFLFVVTFDFILSLHK